MERASRHTAERRIPNPAARVLVLKDSHERNPGMPLDLDVVRAIRVNRSAVERRAATIPTRRTVKKEWQAAWLLRAITLIDLTTLSGDDTPSNVRRLCAKARQPLRDDILAALGVDAARDQRRGGLRLPRTGGDGGGRARRQRHSGGRGVDGIPRGSEPVRPRASPRSRRASRPARRRSTSSSRARTCSPATGEALYDEVRAFRDACGDAHSRRSSPPANSRRSATSRARASSR